MARVKDLWWTTVKNPADPEKKFRKKSAKHPDRGGNRDAKRWLAVWQAPDGREQTKAFAIKDAAKKHARRMEEDAERGEYVDPRAGDAQFDVLGDRWIGSRGANDPASVIRYESIYRLHVKPRFTGRKVKSIKPSEAQAFLSELGERRGPSTVQAALLVLQGVLDLAVADDMLKKNPARSEIVEAPEHDVEKVVAWGDEVVFTIIDHHPEPLRPLPVLGAGCGLREGEQFGLALEDLDFDNKVIHVRRQVKKLGSEFVFALPKNDSERAVPMAGWVEDYLRAHIKKYPPRPYTLPWERLTGPPRTVHILFRWPTDDKHIRARNYSESVWKPATVKAGVIAAPTRVKDGKGKIRLHYVTTRKEGTHALRHYYASVTLADGVSIKELSEYLGHADPAFTLRVYAHMLTTSFARAREAIDRRMRRPRAVAPAGLAGLAGTV